MFAYFPDGSIQYKKNLCSCDCCFLGNFIDCKIEKGFEKFEYGDCESSDEGDSAIDTDSENEEDEDEDRYKLIGETVFEAVEIGSVVAIYSLHGAGELFYLCEVLGKEIASDDLIDEFNHPVSKGTPFLKCKYLEKIIEKKMWYTNG